MSTTTMTKREILMAIVEQPGWEPPDASSVARCVEELEERGLILPRGENAVRGWEATPAAIHNYPHFDPWPDLHDPERARVTPLEAEHGSIASSEPAGIPIERVETLLAGLLRELPIVQVYRLVSAHPGAYPPSGPEWEIAKHIAERMRR